MDHDPDRPPLVRVSDLTFQFDVSPPLLTRLFSRAVRHQLRAVNNVNFEIMRGETFALVGESGCGKTTVGRLLVGLYRPQAGSIVIDDRADDTSERPRRRDPPMTEMVFQDPLASLDPRWRVASIIAEPIRTREIVKGRVAIRRRVDELLHLVGLSSADGEKFPHEFSGGQRQRIAIARALSTNPQFLVCDEPTSALDVSVQAQILNLMVTLQKEFELTYLFISHDLAIVSHMARNIGVMYLGTIVERAPAQTLFRQPRHPYTRMLLDAVPDLDKTRAARPPPLGAVPNPMSPPSGCTFHPRCGFANERCHTEVPRMIHVGPATDVACHAVEEGRLPSDRAYEPLPPPTTGRVN